MPVKKKIEEINPHRLARANNKFASEQIEINGKKQRVFRMMDGHLLAYLSYRGQITEEQYRSGMYFYADWYHSGISGSKAVDYSALRVDVSTVRPVDIRSLSAMHRWVAATKSIGRVHCHPLISMVLLEVTPEQYGREYCGQKSPKLARLAATTLLVAALTALHDHYTTR